ncbi:phenylalanine--tRNA ligase beta subunit-related protein [Streptosporangium sp. NPDC000239]|uniref:B3/4 domain-containing protein n=1 Tax=Streptosporangium jomthongense TaxID=1193683 RepID=A0ABV8F8V4_9ACTN
MYFQHADDIWAEHPGLAAGVVLATGITPEASVEERITEFAAVAGRRLAAGSEAEFPEIQAWRRTFSKMGLKPTQYRCASEALLRRFKKEGDLPRIHPLIDLCNAVSIAFAIPIAVFDLANVSGGLEVRHATGEETYLTFSGETENPEPREVVFADAEGRAHARRWTNRQSGLSAVRPGTASVLIVAEALHDSAAGDVEELTATVAGQLGEVWPVAPKAVTLSRSAPRLEF